MDSLLLVLRAVGVSVFCILQHFLLHLSHNRNAISGISSAVQLTIKRQSRSKSVRVAENDSRSALFRLRGCSYQISMHGLLQNRLKIIHRSGVLKEACARAEFTLT